LHSAQATAVLESLLRDFGKGMHDLSQPLTTLQCRLYLGTMDETPSAMSETIRQSLEDCERLMERVHALQQLLQSQKCNFLTGDTP
jgi:hypothetical protein